MKAFAFLLFLLISSAAMHAQQAPLIDMKEEVDRFAGKLDSVFVDRPPRVFYLEQDSPKDSTEQYRIIIQYSLHSDDYCMLKNHDFYFLAKDRLVLGRWGLRRQGIQFPGYYTPSLQVIAPYYKYEGPWIQDGVRYEYYLVVRGDRVERGIRRIHSRGDSDDAEINFLERSILQR